MIVLSIYDDIVTPSMKINSLSYGMLYSCTPYYSGTPFKNFGKHLGVDYTQLKNTGLYLSSDI